MSLIESGKLANSEEFSKSIKEAKEKIESWFLSEHALSIQRDFKAYQKARKETKRNAIKKTLLFFIVSVISMICFFITSEASIKIIIIISISLLILIPIVYSNIYSHKYRSNANIRIWNRQRNGWSDPLEDIISSTGMQLQRKFREAILVHGIHQVTTFYGNINRVGSPSVCLYFDHNYLFLLLMEADLSWRDSEGNLPSFRFRCSFEVQQDFSSYVKHFIRLDYDDNGKYEMRYK